MGEPNDKSAASNAEPAWTAITVDVEEVRPLRLKHLRPGKPAEAAEYRTDEESTSKHLAVHEAGEVLAAISCHHENRVAGMPPYRNPGIRVRGLAAERSSRDTLMDALLHEVIAIARREEMVEVWGNVRPVQADAYARAGFTPISNPFDIPGLGEHVVMALDLSKRTRKERKAVKQQAKDQAAVDKANVQAESDVDGAVDGAVDGEGAAQPTQADSADDSTSGA